MTGISMVILLAASPASGGSSAKTAATLGKRDSTLEEQGQVFLAKAALQRYLANVVRKDWEGARKLTHPLAQERGSQRRAVRAAVPPLDPWNEQDSELKTYRFDEATVQGRGRVAVSVGEDRYRPAEQELAPDQPAVYVLALDEGQYRVVERRAGAQMQASAERRTFRTAAAWIGARPAAQQARRAQPPTRR